MYYEINIALNGAHFFATASRSITDFQKLKEVYKILRAKFPVSEGYDISVSEHYERIKYLCELES